MNNFAAREFYSVVVGGSALSVNAGFINVVTLAGVFSVTVSHHTGNVSRIAIALFNEDLTTLALVVSIIFSYMFGAFVAGFMVGDNKFRLGKSYGYAVALESAALFGSFVFLRRELIVGEWCAAFGCGLQNALATSYSGAVVRTTHMTGICTDIANILGQACRYDTQAELWRLRVHVPLLISYLFGGLLGQWAYLGLKEKALLFPCFFTGILACIYLTLPYIKEARQVLVESMPFHTIGSSSTNKLDAQPSHAQAGYTGKEPQIEVRVKGDPRKHSDVYASVAAGTVDGDIKKFLADLDDEHSNSRRASASSINDSCAAHSDKQTLLSPSSAAQSTVVDMDSKSKKKESDSHVEILFNAP